MALRIDGNEYRRRCADAGVDTETPMRIVLRIGGRRGDAAEKAAPIVEWIRAQQRAIDLARRADDVRE